ncbi:MAG: hypothetical protein IJ060_04340 [Oscillospiraceae bacterium]|nr:hypothetical protein [Oscillospiraceae bacterium]
MEQRTLLAMHCLNSAIKHRVERMQFQHELDRKGAAYGWIMGYLSDHEGEDIYQRDLEKVIHICRSGISKLVASLEKDQLIERSRVACDDRVKKIVLTERGRAVTEQIRAEQGRLEAALTQGFSESELQVLHGFLRRMQQNLNNET